MTVFIARLVGLLGGLAAVVFLASALVAPELPGLRTLGAMAVVGLGSWVYLDWPALSRWSASRGGVESARAILIVAVGLGVAAASVRLADRHATRWDLTPEQSHSVSPRTAEVLSRLEGPPIEVLGFFVATRDGITARHRARWTALVAAFEAADTPLLTFNTLDPDVDRRRADALGVTSNGVVIVRQGERSQRVFVPDEEDLLNAILRVANARDQIVYVSTGHGERPLGEITSKSLTRLRDALGRLGLSVQPHDLSRSDMPADAAALLIIDPATPLPQASLNRVIDWLDEDRGLLVASEPGRNTGLEPMLESWGLGLGLGVVLDPLVREVTGDASTPLVAEYGLHAAVRGLRAPAVFLGSDAVVEASHDPLTATVFPLALSSEQAWVERSPEVDPARLDPGDLPGPFALLSLVERHPQGIPRGTIVLSGDADWLANEGLERPANQDLAVRVIGALASQRDLVELPPRSAPTGGLAMDWLAQVAVGLLAVLVLPGASLGVGVGLWVRRRVSPADAPSRS